MNAEASRPSDAAIRKAIEGLRPGKSRKAADRKRKPREQLDAESAARHNARNADRFALWAAAGVLDQVVPIIDGAEVARRRDEATEHHARFAERQRRKAAAMRLAAAELLTPEELAALDERRKRYPKGSEYDANLWNTELARLTGRTPLEVFNEWESRHDHASDMVKPVAPASAEIIAIRAGLSEIAAKVRAEGGGA